MRCFWRFYSFVLTGTLILFVTEAQAVVIKDLYEALVPVKTQSRQERKEALTAGLMEVLTRVSGQTIILSEDPENPLLMAIQNPTRYTRQFRYRKARRDGSGLNIWIKYDEKAVNNLLQANSLPVWGHTRPPSLVWMVVAENGQRRLMSNTENHPVKAEFKALANKRGLPVSFPLMDLTDRGNVSISDIWGNFEERITTASQRYNAEATIVGRLYKNTSDEWSIRWTIFHQGQKQEVVIDNEKDLSAGIIPVIAQTAQILAQQFAMVKTEEVNENVVVKVKGVETLKRFNYIAKYLKSLSAVSAINPLVVTEQSVTFKLTTRGGRLALAQAIKLGHVLAEQVPTNSTEVPDANGPDLVYQLVQ